MKLLLPLLISIPSNILTVALLAAITMNLPTFIDWGIPKIIGLYPIFAFATCLALAMVFRTKEWKVGTAISAIPLVIFSLRSPPGVGRRVNG